MICFNLIFLNKVKLNKLNKLNKLKQIKINLNKFK